MAHELKSGDQFGRYEIKRLLGRGGMSDVYLAYDPMLDREVAVKVLPPEFSRNEERAKRFAKEVRAVAALNHHNIVTIYQVGEQDGCQFCTMALLPGGDLRKRLKKGLKTAEALKIAAQVATALGHAHQRGLIHRDIKPGNIMFDESDNAIVVDFGIAKVLDSDTHLTGTGKSIGTPHYMSPEQAQGMATIDGRSDIYSLGIVLYEMLTGKVPFDADNTIGIAFKHVQEEAPPLPREMTEFQPLMDRMLCKQPEERFDTAEDAAIAIAAQRATVPGGITKTSMIERRRTPTPKATPAFRTTGEKTTQPRSAKKPVTPPAPTAPKKTTKKAARKATPKPAASPPPGRSAPSAEAAKTQVTHPSRSLPTQPTPTIPDLDRTSTSEQLAAKPGAKYTLPVLISIASLIAIAVLGHMTWQYFSEDERPRLDPQANQSSGSDNKDRPPLLQPETVEPPQSAQSDTGTPTIDDDVSGDPDTTSPTQLDPIAQVDADDDPLVDDVIDPEEQRLAELRSLASDRLREAEAALRSADQAQAGRYAPTAYARAQARFDDARGALLQSGDPQGAAELAAQAREEASMAASLAEGAIADEQRLLERIPEAEAAIALAGDAGAATYANDLFERAMAALDDARAAMQRLDFASAEDNINAAIRRADDAAALAEETAAAALAQPSEDPPAQTPVSQPPVVDERADQIARLLADAQADYQALRLARPAGNNALEKLNQVLTLDPGNPDARAALQQIAARYLGLARDSLAGGRWDEARARVNQARDIQPGINGAETLLADIASAEANAGPRAGEMIQDRLASGGPGPEMMVIGPGNFVMGSGAGADFERPATPVNVERPFAIGRREVTVDDFSRFVEASGYRSLAERSDGCIQWLFGWRRQNDADWRNPGFEQQSNHPVTCVSIDDAQAYAQWLSEQTGETYRLPSEAEWEFAARAGNSAASYWQGDPAQACQAANISDLTRAEDHGLEQTSDNVFLCRDGAIQTDAVGRRAANDFGIYDMLGNLEEWTADCWSANHRGASGNTSPRIDGDCNQAAVRGGSWHTLPGLVTASYRAAADRSARVTTTGFRLVREID